MRVLLENDAAGGVSLDYLRTPLEGTQHCSFRRTLRYPGHGDQHQASIMIIVTKALQIVESCNSGLENIGKFGEHGQLKNDWRTWSWVNSRLENIKRNVEP